jgi:hypothetical protein
MSMTLYKENQMLEEKYILPKKKKTYLDILKAIQEDNRKYAMLRTIGPGSVIYTEKKKGKTRKEQKRFPMVSQYSIDFHCIILASK